MAYNPYAGNQWHTAPRSAPPQQHQQPQQQPPPLYHHPPQHPPQHHHHSHHQAARGVPQQQPQPANHYYYGGQPAYGAPQPGPPPPPQNNAYAPPPNNYAPQPPQNNNYPPQPPPQNNNYAPPPPPQNNTYPPPPPQQANYAPQNANYAAPRQQNYYGAPQQQAPPPPPPPNYGAQYQYGPSPPHSYPPPQQTAYSARAAAAPPSAPPSYEAPRARGMSSAPGCVQGGVLFPSGSTVTPPPQIAPSLDERARRAFAAADKDQNGYISFQEFLESLRELQISIPYHDALDKFSKLDTDKDGRVVETEYVNGQLWRNFFNLAISRISQRWIPMMTPLQFRGVIFDLDGTLIDSLAHIAAACNHVLATHNHSPLPTRLYAKFAGGGNHVLLEQTLTHVNLATTPEAINSAVAQKRAYDDSADTALLRPFPGASDALQQLTDAKLPLAVLSNKAEHLVRAAVARVFPHTPFLAVHGARPDVALKPDGSPALAILHKHMPGVEPNQCAFVGDTPVDMRTARNAGMLPIGVSWGFRSSTELKEAGAHVVVDTMSQLADVILNRAK